MQKKKLSKKFHRVANKLEAGQATVEFTLSLAVTFSVVLGALTTFWMEWKRLQCVKRLYEHTHAALISPSGNSSLSGWSSGIRIQGHSDRIEGEATCERSKEKVVFYRLEPEAPASRSFR